LPFAPLTSSIVVILSFRLERRTIPVA